MYFRGLVVRLFAVVGLLVAFGLRPGVARADDPDTNMVIFDVNGIEPFRPPAPHPNVIGSFKDSVAACPAGDSVLARHPWRLRIQVEYDDSSGVARNGVPPESVWVQITDVFGGLVANDIATQTFADDSVRYGFTNITLPSFSGCGTIWWNLYVSGVWKGLAHAYVRTTDTNADGRTTLDDQTNPCDLTYGSAEDTSFIRMHAEHWHRNALHGTLVQRTSLCETCADKAPNTRGEGQVFWSPTQRYLSYTSFVSVPGGTSCKVFIVPADPAIGNASLQVTSDPLWYHDYDPSWSPQNTELVFDRGDSVVIRKPLPWLESSETVVTASNNCGVGSKHGDDYPAVSPDGLWVAFSRDNAAQGPPCNGTGGWSLWKVPIGGGTAVQLTPTDAVADFYASWSPDGQWIYFQRNDIRISTGWTLWRVPSAGGSAIRVFVPANGSATYDAVQPNPSSDGLIVAAGYGERSDFSRNVHTYTLDPALSPLDAARLVPNFPDTIYSEKGSEPVLTPKPSPDGTRLALASKQVWASRRNMNLPPVITAIDGQAVSDTIAVVDRTVGQDTTLNLTYARSDPESDALSDSAFYLRPDLGMSFSSQSFSWPVGDSPTGTYVVKFQVREESGGTDQVLARIAVRDITPPRVTTDLSCDVDPDDCTLFHLHWTAPADDSNYTATGPATEYNLKISTSSIASDWTGGLTLSQSPSTPGTTESYDVSVGAGQSRYIRLKTKDDVGNWSLISNQIHIAGPPVNSDCLGGGMSAGGGGDGGGASLKPAAGSTSLRPSTVVPIPQAENSMLNGVAAGKKGCDAYRLSGVAIGEGGEGQLSTVRVREARGHAVNVDAAQLIAVDHAAGVSAYHIDAGFILGVKEAASAISVVGGGDLTTTLINGVGYGLSSRETLAVTLSAGGGNSPVIIGASGSGAIDLLVADDQGAWRIAARAYPRTRQDEVILTPPSQDRFRLASEDSSTLSFVGRLVASSEHPTVRTSNLLFGQDAKIGDVLAAVATTDSLSTTLVGPDTLALAYSVPPLAEGSARDYFVVISATPLSPQSMGLARLRPADGVLPLRFALRQNWPNPFRTATTIRFDLPSPVPVRLDVFDLAGRHVRTLASGQFAAGYQSVSWDQRDGNGNQVRPGVYLYRLNAGSFRDQKKMVLLAN